MDMIGSYDKGANVEDPSGIGEQNNYQMRY